MSEDIWTIHLKILNLNLIDKRFLSIFPKFIPTNIPCSHDIDLMFVFNKPFVGSIDIDVLWDYFDFFKNKEIHYDMENKTSTTLNEKYKPTILLDESELLYLKMKFEPIIGEFSIGG